MVRKIGIVLALGCVALVELLWLVALAGGFLWLLGWALSFFGR